MDIQGKGELDINDMKYISDQLGYGYSDEQLQDLIHSVGGYGAETITADRFNRFIEKKISKRRTLGWVMLYDGKFNIESCNNKNNLKSCRRIRRFWGLFPMLTTISPKRNSKKLTNKFHTNSDPHSNRNSTLRNLKENLNLFRFSHPQISGKMYHSLKIIYKMLLFLLVAVAALHAVNQNYAGIVSSAFAEIVGRTCV